MATKTFIWTKVIVEQLNDFLHIKDGYSVAACFINYDTREQCVENAVIYEGDLNAKDHFCGWCIVKIIDEHTVEPVTKWVFTLSELSNLQYENTEDAH